MNETTTKKECALHGAVEVRVSRAEYDIQELWKMGDVVKDEIKKVTVKLSWLFGVLTAVQVIGVALITLMIKSHPVIAGISK